MWTKEKPKIFCPYCGIDLTGLHRHLRFSHREKCEEIFHLEETEVEITETNIEYLRFLYR